MNSSAERAWSRPPEHVDAMAQMTSELSDLENLFEFGDMDLNPIPSLDSAPFPDALHSSEHATNPNTPYPEINDVRGIGSAGSDFGAHDQYNVSQAAETAQQQQQHQQQDPQLQQMHQQHGYGVQPPTSMPYNSDPIYQANLQQGFHNSPHFQQYHPQSGYPHHQHIPPTPNSFEMHGEAGRFMQPMDPQQRALLEQRYQLRKEDAIAFTPMVSPAGTPQYNIPPAEFTTMPGAYFSPLTSPLLHAQNSQAAHQHPHPYYANTSAGASSGAPSPLDPHPDVDMLMDHSPINDTAATQPRPAQRRKAPVSRNGNPLTRVKQSPLSKPAKRKSATMLSGSSSLTSVDQAFNLAQAGKQSAGVVPTQSGSQSMNDSSENGSISPEPLSEALMGPPPRPTSSVTNSPAIAGQQQGTPGKAATPKSLLSNRYGNPAHSNGQHDSQVMDLGAPALEDLQLPAAAAAGTEEAAKRADLPQLNTQVSQASLEDTPRLGARKTPKLGPLSTPSSAKTPSAMPSPSISGSPMLASTPGALLRDKKLDSKSSRSSKKRGNGSGSGSHLVSPALRPRISPSIKPLLPEGASLNSPTHALLLASKSNYQNLLEGNHLPGVHYPDSLSTGLTSKRTSHKVAEQGRRNRINEALKEMQSLLPKPAVSTASPAGAAKGSKESASDGSPDATDGAATSGNAADGKDSKEDAAAKSNSSKAATVESANEYIRKLQKENALLLQFKREHEALKRGLEERTTPADAAASAVNVSVEGATDTSSERAIQATVS